MLYFINKYEPTRWQHCQWCRLAHNHNYSKFQHFTFVGQKLDDVTTWWEILSSILISTIIVKGTVVKETICLDAWVNGDSKKIDWNKQKVSTQNKIGATAFQTV